MIVIELADGPVCVENAPQMRTDVYRENDDGTEMISVKDARNMRQMWTEKEKTCDNDQQVRRTPEVLILTCRSGESKGGN